MPKVIKKAQVPRPTPITTAAAADSATRSGPAWSEAENDTLLSARASGYNWNQIAERFFPGKKTYNACRKHHERLMVKRNAEDWDGVKLETLAMEYMNLRQDMWSILGSRIGEKWQLVERKCMQRGFKNLQQAYRSAQKKKGTYNERDDSGIGWSDPEDEIDQGSTGTAEPSRQYRGGYSPQRGGPSIQSMLQGCQLR